MARNREPVLKRAKALGIEPQYLGINKKSKRQVQQSRRKKSEYGIQLTEKQKVKFYYGLQETQFRNTYEKATKRAGGAGENLLIMLDSHGHFLVNGKKANIPSMELKAGDVISVKEKSKSSPKFKELRDMVITTPQWLDIDLDKLEGKILTAPTRADIDLPIEERYIVEFYSR